MFCTIFSSLFLQVVDNNLPSALSGFLFTAVEVVVVIIIITIRFPIFVVAIPVLIVIYLALIRIYLPASRQVKVFLLRLLN